MEAAVAGHLVWCCTDCGAIYRTDFPRCPNDGAEVIAASRDPLVGSTVDNYVIEDLIGEGAMGRVYRAHHRHLHGRRYALKVLIGDLAVTAANRIRFAKEAESASRLSHPNVVGVFDVGRSTKGLLYIAMELVDGESASTILDRGPMEVSRVLAIARGVCAGLAHAHAAGIIHRDLKPDNILIVDGDVPRIVDFGLAISTDRTDTRLTTTGMTMGTPAYIAPEQASGKPVDHRADLYALGVSMFEMLTQKLPFDANDALEMVTAKVTRSAPTLEQRAPEIRVPGEVSRIVAKLIERYPEDRFDSAADVLVALDHYERPRKSRGPLIALIAGVVVVAAGAGAWALTAHPWRASEVVVAHAPAATRVDEPATRGTPPVVKAPPPIDEPSAAIESPVVDPADHVDPTAKPAKKDRLRPRTKAAKPTKSAATTPASTPVVTPASIDQGPPPAAPPVGPPAAAPPVELPRTVDAPAPIPPAPAPSFAAHVAGVDVTGSLSAAVISRALDRIGYLMEACKASSAHTVVVHFAINESRRAESVTASRESRCVVAAIASLRTETAPDVGDVEVTVKVVFR